MYSYIAYGLGIRSALPLPELVARETVTDVAVRLGKVEMQENEKVAFQPLSLPRWYCKVNLN